MWTTMLRYVVPVFAPALLFVPAGAAPKEKDGEPPALSFPTTVGARWVYEQKAGGGTTEITDVVTRIESKGGTYLVSVGREADGKVMPNFTASVSRDGITYVSSVGRALDPPHRILKLPAKAGDTWVWKEPGSAEKAAKMTYRTGSEEEVEVPAGRFRAVRVDAESEHDGEAVRVFEWYAAGVGLVKGVYRIGDREVRVALKTFSPGKK